MKASWLQDATPIMYRLFRQLGSYPYQTQPSEDTLTFDQLSLAILILTGCFSCSFSGPKGQPLGKVSLDEKTLLRLIFQSLTAAGPKSSQSNKGIRSRASDIDLQSVHAILSAFTAGGIGFSRTKNVLVDSPKLPDHYHFPSSFSNKVDARLPKNELHVWSRLLIAYEALTHDTKDCDSEAAAELLVRQLERHKQKSISDATIGYAVFMTKIPEVRYSVFLVW